MGKDELKGVFIDAILGYDFYKADFNGQRFCLLVSKREEKSTPTKYKQLSNRLEQLLACPIVFLFGRLEYYERNRLIEQGAFFVVSEKYVYLPYLIINAKDTDKKSTEVLNATSQFLLLYHLQINSVSGLTTFRDMLIDTVVTHTCPSFCHPISKPGIESWLLRDTKLQGDLNAERSEMDKIYNQLIADNQPLRSWYTLRRYSNACISSNPITFR